MPVTLHGSSGDIIGGGGAPMNMNGKESLWIDRGWRAADTEKDAGHMSDAKLLGNNQTATCTTSGSGSTGSSSVQHGNYCDASTDYAEVDTRNFSSFYNPCKQVSRQTFCRFEIDC